MNRQIPSRNVKSPYQKTVNPIRAKNRQLSQYAQRAINPPISKQRRISRNNRVVAAITTYNEAMHEIKKIRIKEEEKSRMLNTFLPSPSYSRWVMKEEERRQNRKCEYKANNNSKDDTISDEGNQILLNFHRN